MDLALKSMLMPGMMMPGMMNQQPPMPSSNAMGNPTRQMPMQQAPQLQDSPNPIGVGSLAGIKAAKQSYRMDEDEERRAEGLAIQQFFANMAANTNPSRSGALAQSFNPAVKAYLSEQQRVESLNNELLQQEEKRQQHQENMALKREAINTKKSGSPESAALQGLYTQKLRDEGIIPKNAILASTLSPNERLHYTKERSQKTKRGQGLARVINITHELDKITDKYPQLSTHMVNAMMTSEAGKPGVIDLAKLKLSDATAGEEIRAAAEKFNKLSNDLVLGGLEGVPGRMASDMYKTVLMGTKPTLGLTHEAIKYVNNHIREQSMPYYEDALANQKAMGSKENYFLPDYVPPLQNEAAQQNVPRGTQNPGNTDDFDDSDYTPEEIAEAQRRLNAGG